MQCETIGWSTNFASRQLLVKLNDTSFGFAYQNGTQFTTVAIGKTNGDFENVLDLQDVNSLTSFNGTLYF